MKRWTVLTATVLTAVILACGCSGGVGDANPAAPSVNTQLTSDSGHSSQSQTYLWGYYDIYFDAEKQSLEAVPNREAMFAANVVTFLNNNPAGLQFSGIQTNPSPDYMDVTLTIGITHPFPGLPQYDGYDVRGVFIGDGSGTFDYNGAKYPVSGTDQTMEVNDGYTRWYNPSEFMGSGLFSYTVGNFASRNYTGNCEVNPYMYFADGLSATANVWDFLVNTDRNGVFSSGASNSRFYEIRFPNSKGIKYNYAVVANWEGEDPSHHPGNAPEAPACSIEYTPNVWYEDGSNNGGYLILDISLFCWKDRPSSIIVESSVQSAEHEFTPDEMIPVGGTETYSTWHVEIPADDVQQRNGNIAWILAENDNEDYSNPSGIPNQIQNLPLTSYFIYYFDALAEAPCDDPILTEMNPGSANVSEALDDAEIIGEEFDNGPSLACYLTNGSIDIIGTDVTYVDAQTVTADFDFGDAGAESGYYDLYFTDGDGCDVMLEDAMLLTEFPVMVADGTDYLAAKFVEDSNGVFHILCSVNEVGSTSFEVHWFHSEDSGMTWTDEGNIFVWAHSANATAQSVGHVLAVDGNGGVYAALPERRITGYEDFYTHLAYLDTATHDDPDAWTASDWEAKIVTGYYYRDPSYCALSVTPSGEIYVYARHYSIYQRYVYATSWASLPSTQYGTPFPTSISGHSLQEHLVSRNNGIVYNPDTDTFFLAIGGRWDLIYCGAYLVEYDPDYNTYTWRSSVGYEFDHVNGLGSFNDIYYGDVAIDSDNNIHWVYQYTWPTNEPTSYYSRQYQKYVMSYGTNVSGSWVEQDPISDGYIFDPQNLYSDPRAAFRPAWINLVVNSDDELIMNWMKCTDDRKMMTAVTEASDADWPDPSVLMDTDATYPLYQGPHGEAYGDNGLVAITYTSQPTPSSTERGSLIFTMTDGG